MMRFVKRFAKIFMTFVLIWTVMLFSQVAFHIIEGKDWDTAFEVVDQEVNTMFDKIEETIVSKG